ncbi:putative basic proline-rich protein-like [Iris pallida]|uniref:Basic proline-rich protein-like n=1 Tax=Iris pallida TaxID=29817 RepID=A0AAX6E192_IRIPA|nr:putative basic proline-rich protein-like [Iris pallida]
MVDLAGRPPRPGPRLRPTQRPPCFPPPPSLVGRTPGGSLLPARPQASPHSAASPVGVFPPYRRPLAVGAPSSAYSRRGVSPLSTPPTPLAAALGATALGAEKSLLRRSRLSRPTSLPPFRCPPPSVAHLAAPPLRQRPSVPP